MGRPIEIMAGTGTGAANPGATPTMLNGSLTLDQRGGEQPYLVGILEASEAPTRENYINVRISSEGSKDQDFRRFYCSNFIDDIPAQRHGQINSFPGFYPIMKQCQDKDVVTCGLVDVATTNVMHIFLLVTYGGPPEILNPMSIRNVKEITLTAATPADCTAGAWGTAGIDDIPSGSLSNFKKKMKVIGGYLVPETAAGGGAFRISQSFKNSVKVGLCTGNGFLTLPGGGIIVLCDLDNSTLIDSEAFTVAADEIEAGLYVVEQ